jgi:hypothetical protein
MNQILFRLVISPNRRQYWYAWLRCNHVSVRYVEPYYYSPGRRIDYTVAYCPRCRWHNNVRRWVYTLPSQRWNRLLFV